MTETEKKLLQAQHRSEEAQARNRVKERKARTRRLIQEGAILEKVLPEVRTMELSALEDYLMQEAAAAQLNPPGGLRENGGLLLFSPVRAHLLTTAPKGQQWYLPLASRALCEADAAAAGSLQTMPQRLQVLLSSSAQVAVVSVLETVCSLPAQTCHRQLYLRL